MGCYSILYSKQSESPLKLVYSAQEERQKRCTNSYRYGFNGKEKEDGWSEGNYSFEFREYDSRTIRFNSIDLLSSKYPFQSPYVFAANSPIQLVDVLGLGPGDIAPGEKKGNAGSDIEYSSQTEAQKTIQQKSLLAPNGKWYAVPENANYTYSNGYQEVADQIKAEGVWQINYEDGRNFMWDNLKGEFVLNTSENGAGENDMPGYSNYNPHSTPGTTYAGNKNPKNKITGEDDFSQPAQNIADYFAKGHDFNFDNRKIAGATGVLKKESSAVNKLLILQMQIVIGMYFNGATDPVTGTYVSKRTYESAVYMLDTFKFIENLKDGK